MTSLRPVTSLLSDLFVCVCVGVCGLDPLPPGFSPPYPRPNFSSLPPPPFFPYFWGGYPAQNSDFLPPTMSPPPIFRRKPPYPQPPCPPPHLSISGDRNTQAKYPWHQDVKDPNSYNYVWYICILMWLGSWWWTALLYPHFNEVERGHTGFMSVSPAVRLVVCPSVDGIVDALYLQQYSLDPFHIIHFIKQLSSGYFPPDKVKAC